ncbi:MAG: hypothetical protein ACKVII_12050 [Planctomycetales bacterium]|jgi:hypothetical protein
MLKTWQQLISGQYGAALCMLSRCIDQCPESLWNEPVGNLKFCQVVFFTDFYLEDSDRTFRDQPFHRENADFFRDYEELEYVEQKQLYDRASIRKYLQHCRTKFARVIAEETEQTLVARCGFERRDFSLAELHVCNVRHIQHHASQLSLHLRRETGEGVPWVGSGWRDE